MWTQITNARAWDDALRQCYQPHVLQSWAWGAFKERWGWSAQRWAFVEGEHMQACVQVLRRKVGPLCVLYAPKGAMRRQGSDRIAEYSAERSDP